MAAREKNEAVSADNLLVGDCVLPAPIVILCGHYGVGKTNLALNLAHTWAGAGFEVTLVDLDVVNPFFRSSDYSAALQEQGVRVIAPVFAGSNIDGPSLSPAIRGAIEQAAAGVLGGKPEKNRRVLLIDAGGDDAGATALGRYAHALHDAPYTLLYVVNCRRSLTQTADEAVSILHEIEQASHLKAAGIINNTHLQGDTDIEVVAQGIPFAEQIAKDTGLPLVCTTVPVSVFEQVTDRKTVHLGQTESTQTLYPVRVYVRTPWE